MTRSEFPENWQELMSGYVLDNLTAEEAELMQHLLAQHPHLANEVARLQEVYHLLPYALPEQEPPAALEERIIHAIDGDTGSSSRAVSPPPGLPQRQVSWWIGGTIAAVVVGALGIQNYQLQNQLRQTEDRLFSLRQDLESVRADADKTNQLLNVLRQPGSIVLSLEGTGQASNAAGSLVVMPDGYEMLLLVQNLPQLPDGKTYRAWAKSPDTENPIFCGQFNSNAEGKVRWTSPQTLTLSAPIQILITIDSLSNPPRQVGTPIMHSRV